MYGTFSSSNREFTYFGRFFFRPYLLSSFPLKGKFTLAKQNVYYDICLRLDKRFFFVKVIRNYILDSEISCSNCTHKINYEISQKLFSLHIMVLLSIKVEGLPLK